MECKMIYKLHSPRDGFYGEGEPQSLDDIVALSKSMGLNMVERFIPDGLNSFEMEHSGKAVIFDVTSEDVTMIEEG